MPICISGRFQYSPLDGDFRVAHGVILDREEAEIYNLTLCATDTGTPPQRAMVLFPLLIYLFSAKKCKKKAP